MINNELITVQVLSYDGQKDSYGVIRTDTPTTREVEMVIKNYLHNIENNPIYDKCTDIGLTFDRLITDKNQIKVGEETYNVLYVIPSRRCQQILLQRT